MVKRMRMRRLLALSQGLTRLAGLVVLSLLMLGVAFADEDDPPGRVARVSYVQGSVSLEPAGQQDWVGAEINRPLTTNDKLWSDMAGSRAELDIGGAVIRLGANTGFSFLNLDDSVAQMQVTAGSVIVRVRELLENQTYEVDTPNVALLLDRPGMYRVDVSDSGDSTVVRVSDGQVEASGGGQTMPVYNQQMVTFTGTDQLSASAGSLGGPDGFDDWSFERDREYDQSRSRQYVAENVAGAEDLDENGQWENTPDYGNVWIPTAVAVGWTPYSFGHWSFISPWGWTWVDNAPWGYAPFHYGRWAHWHDRWCWVPGPRHVRAVYSPAMVAWVGGRAGGAGVGWFPLGPREVYVPGYRVSDRYVRNINITNTTIVDHTYITNVYRNHVTNVTYVNSRVPGAVTTVSRTVFTSAQPVNAHRMNLPPAQFARVTANSRPPEIAPVRQSFLGGAATHGFGRRPPQAVLNRDVVARTAPPAASTARVRLLAPSPQQANRGGFGGGRGPAMQERPGASPSMQQPRPESGFNASPSRPGAFNPPQQSREGGAMGPSGRDAREGMPSVQGQRPPMQARPGANVPSNVPNNAPQGDTRSWADRAHALGQPSLPPSQAPRYERPAQERESGDANPAQGRGVPNGSPREFTDRPQFAPQQGRVDPPRPPVNNYTRPQMERPPVERPQFENRSVEERRPNFQERRAEPIQQEPQPQRFVSPPPVPQQHFTPPPAPPPQQRFTPPPQPAAPQQRFTPPPQPAAPQQRFTPPPQPSAPQQRFTPPPQAPVPQQHFAPPPPASAPPSQPVQRGQPPGRPEPQRNNRTDQRRY
jgi:uncharacterized protein DUF6600